MAKYKHRVKKKVLLQKIDAGVIKMPNIKSMIKAIKLMWIKILLTENNNVTLMAYMNSKITGFNEYFTYQITAAYLPSSPAFFFKHIFNLVILG